MTSNEDILELFRQSLVNENEEIQNRIMQFVQNVSECNLGGAENWKKAACFQDSKRKEDETEESWKKRIAEERKEKSREHDQVLSNWTTQPDETFDPEVVNDKLVRTLFGRLCHFRHVPSCFSSTTCRHGFPSHLCKKTEFYKLRTGLKFLNFVDLVLVLLLLLLLL